MLNTRTGKIIGTSDTGEITGLHPRTTLIKGRNSDDDFPAPIKLSRSRFGFFEHEIEAWLVSRREVA